MIQRYSYSLIGEGEDEVFDNDSADLKEFEDGGWININDCIVLEQDNMMLGDSLDMPWELNGKMQREVDRNKVYDVMIILKERK